MTKRQLGFVQLCLDMARWLLEHGERKSARSWIRAAFVASRGSK